MRVQQELRITAALISCCCSWFALVAGQYATGPGAGYDSKALISVFESRNLELAFPTPQERERVISAGLYDPDGVVPIDVDVYYTRKFHDHPLLLGLKVKSLRTIRNHKNYL